MGRDATHLETPGVRAGRHLELLDLEAQAIRTGLDEENLREGGGGGGDAQSQLQFVNVNPVGRQEMNEVELTCSDALLFSLGPAEVWFDSATKDGHQ